MTGDFKDIGIKEFVMRKLTGNYNSGRIKTYVSKYITVICWES